MGAMAWSRFGFVRCCRCYRATIGCAISRQATGSPWLHKTFFVWEVAPLDVAFAEFARIGLGYHTPLTSAVDGIAEVTYEDLDIAEGDHVFDESGYGLALGARALFTEKLEGTARVRYVDFGDEDDVIVGVELLYLFNHSFGLVAAYETGNEDFISFGARYQF